jgi:hypothetical protein
MHIRAIPIYTDAGIMRLITILVRVEERLQNFLGNNKENKIPSYKTWMVKMWHFGRDALTGYAGEKFEMTIGDFENLFRVYTKELNGKNRIRVEKQESPQKTISELINEKLDTDY